MDCLVYSACVGPVCVCSLWIWAREKRSLHLSLNMCCVVQVCQCHWVVVLCVGSQARTMAYESATTSLDIGLDRTLKLDIRIRVYKPCIVFYCWARDYTLSGSDPLFQLQLQHCKIRKRSVLGWELSKGGAGCQVQGVSGNTAKCGKKCWKTMCIGIKGLLCSVSFFKVQNMYPQIWIGSRKTLLCVSSYIWILGCFWSGLLPWEALLQMAHRPIPWWPPGTGSHWRRTFILSLHHGHFVMTSKYLRVER